MSGLWGAWRDASGPRRGPSHTRDSNSPSSRDPPHLQNLQTEGADQRESQIGRNWRNYLARFVSLPPPTTDLTPRFSRLLFPCMNWTVTALEGLRTVTFCCKIHPRAEMNCDSSDLHSPALVWAFGVTQMLLPWVSLFIYGKMAVRLPLTGAAGGSLI